MKTLENLNQSTLNLNTRAPSGLDTASCSICLMRLLNLTKYRYSYQAKWWELDGEGWRDTYELFNNDEWQYLEVWESDGTVIATSHEEAKELIFQSGVSRDSLLTFSLLGEVKNNTTGKRRKKRAA